MKIPKIYSLVCGLFALAFLLSADAESTHNDKVLRYHELLLKRPDSEVIFTRFYDEWLINASIEQLEEFLQKEAENGDARDWQVLAIFYFERGEEAKALESYQSATALAPEDGQLWLSRAESAKALQDYEQSLENLDQALSCELAGPQALKARRLKGSCLALSGRNEEANLIWQMLLEDFPDDHELMEDLIDLQIGEGMLDEALSTALKLVESSKDPYQKALYQIEVGDIYIRQEERDKAKTHLSELIDKVGSGSWLEKEILAKLDLLVSGMNDLSAALNFYSELSKRYPQRVEIWKRSIQAQAASGDVDVAIEQYQQLLRLTPGDRQNHEAFIDFLERNERLEHAAKNSLKLCELYPEDRELRLRHANLLDRVGDRDALLETLKSYEALLGDAANERLQVAKVYDQFGCYDQSGPIYKTLAETNKNDVESVENYAIWLFEQGEEDEAIELLESLAKDVSREGLIRICRTLSGEFEREKAYALLKSRLDDFRTDSLYLLELSNMALSQSVPEEALGWVRTLVLKAESPFELSSAVNLAVSVIQRAEQVDTLLAEFDDSDELNIQELSLKAHLEEVSGDSISVDATIERMREKGGVIAYSEISRILEAQGRLKEAVDAMEKLIAMDAGRNPLNLRRIVGLLQQSGSWDRAIEYVNLWKSVTPGDPKVWLREADLLEAAGRNKEAIQQMRRGLYKFEDDLDLTLRLASIYQSATEYAEAARIYWRLFNQEEKDSERLRWIREIARIDQARGTTDELIEKLTVMRKQQRESVFPILALAEVYRANNYSDLYRESLVEASNLQPDNPELLRQVASLHENYGDLDAAEKSLQHLVRIDGDSANVNALSGFYLRLGETEKAYDLIFQSEPEGGHTPRDLESIIDSLAASGEWEIALEQAESAAAKFPEDWRLGYLVSVCLEANGREEEAFQKWLTLLGPQQEISDLPKPSQTHHARLHYGYYGQLMPEQTSDAAEILIHSSQTFSYLNQNSRHSSGHSMGMGLSGFAMQQIKLPMDTKSLQSMCALQMAAMASDWPEEKRLKASQIMQRSGIDCAPLLVALGGARSHQTMPVRLLNYVQENPTDTDSLPLLVNYIHQRSFVPDDILKRGLETYAKENPSIASEFALAMLMREADESERLINYIVEHVSYADEERIMYSNRLLQRLLSLSHNRPSTGDTATLSESQLAALQKEVEIYYYGEDAYSNDRQKLMQVMQSFNVLLMLYFKDGATKEFISVLEEQLSRLEKMSYASLYGYHPHFSSHRGRYNNLQLQMPSFEQSYLELSNPAITRFLAKPGTGNRHHPSAVLGEEEWSNLDLVSHVDDFTRPELKVLVYWMAGDTEGCEKMFEQLVSVDPQPHHLYVYATWLLEIKEDKLAAIRALENALEHPEARTARARYEQAIVAIVLEMVREQDLESVNQDALATARSAILKLRKSVALQGYQMQSYANTLNELGLVEEAEQMLKPRPSVAASGGFPGSSMSFAPGASSRRTNPMDRITELAGEGKSGAAAAEAVREMRRQIQRASFHSPPQLTQIIQRINGARIADEVLQRFDPGDSLSRRRKETYAMILDQFGHDDKAKAVWESLIEQRPEEPKYQLELALFQEGESRLQSIQKLMQIDPVYEDELGEWIVQKMNYSNRNQDFDTWMALFDFVILYLEELEPELEAYRNLTWATYYAVNAGSRVYLGRVSFKDLLRENQSNYRGQDEFRERRINGLLRIIHALQQHPQTSEEAFMLRYAFDTAQGNAIEREVYEPLARQAIEKTVDLEPVTFSQPYYSGSSRRWVYISQGRHHHGGQRLNDEMSPLAYLMELYQKEPDSGVARLEELHDAIAEGDPKLATAIKDYIDMVNMDDTGFVKACLEWAEGLGYQYGGGDNHKLNILPYLIQSRDLKGEALLDFVQKIQSSMLAQQDYNTLNYFVGKIIDILADLDNPALIERWFNSVTTEFIGPKEDWPSFVSRWGGSTNYYGNNHPAYKMRMLRQVFNNIASQSRDLAIPAIRYTKKHQIGIQGHVANVLRSKLDDGFESVDEAIAWCESQELFGPIEVFDTLLVLDEQVLRNQSNATSVGEVPLLPQNRNGSVYEYALTRISFADDDKKEKRKAFIEQLKEHDFGGVFLAAMLKGNSGKKTALEALEKEIEAVRSMPLAKKAELAYLYKYWIKDATVDTEANPALYLVQSSLMGSLEDEVKAYLDGASQTSRNSYQERQKIEAWLSHLILEDTETCLKLYHKWLENSEKAARTNMNYSVTQTMNNNRSLLQQTLQSFRNSIEGLEPSVRFMAALLDDDLGDSFGDLYYTSYQIRDNWRTAINEREKEAAKSDVKKHSIFVPELLGEFDAKWKTEAEAQYAALTLWSFVIERMRLNDDELEDLMTWAADVNPDASLSHRVFAAAVMALAEVGNEKLENGSRRAAELLGSDEIDVGIRMAFWRCLTSSRLRDLPNQNSGLSKSYALTMQEFLAEGHLAFRRDYLQCLRHIVTQELANENREAFKAFYVEMRDNTPKAYGRGDQNELKQYYNSMATLALKIGDTDEAKNLVRKHHWALQGNTVLFVEMIRAGEYASALQLMPDAFNFNLDNSIRYDAKLHEKLPGFLEEVSNEKLRYRAKAALMLVSDDGDLKKAEIPEREDRARSLIDGLEPGDTMLSPELLNDIAQKLSDKKLIIKHISFVVDDLELRAVIEQANNHSFGRRDAARAELSLLEIILEHEVESGEIDNLKSHLSSLDGHLFDRNMQNSYKKLNKLFDGYIKKRLAKGDQKALVANAPFVKKMTDMAYSEESLGRDLNPYFAYLLTQLASQSASTAKEALSEASLKRIEELKSKWDRADEVFSLVDEYAGSGNREEDKGARRETIKLMLSDKAYIQKVWVTSADALFQALSYSSRYEKEDIIAVIPGIISQSHPREPWLAFVLADAYSDSSKNVDETRKWLTYAMEATERHPEIADVSSEAAVRLARISFDVDKDAEATLEYLKQISLDLLSKKSKGEAERLKKIAASVLAPE